ncbi:TonB-dependent receptor [Ideonella sp.]|uniref:TonB-dependent receptor n=1 Tax=Ideonella sp. TaxID=1929293 RepID=UPI002B475661|nr:TonB-dependent receptor [Ideonella sp.]HJV69070.1 TonB-dependent receptor [Ideonella sp.]
MGNLKSVKRTLALIAVGAAAPALAQAPAAEEPAAGQAPQRVEITGSSIKRIDAETALPVQVLRREDIQATGAANVEQLLTRISAATSNGVVTASMAAGATTGGIASASLRGLSGTRTLILINGRRVSAFGAIGDSVSVDVNSIPLAAIERVEILKDGASAVYGSDAVAGVINFVLRRDLRGGEFSAEYGSSTHGDGAIGRFSAVWGHGDAAADGYNLTLIGTYQKEDGLYGRDRDFADSSINVAHNNDVTSGNAFPANIVINGHTYNPLAPDCAPSVSSPLFGPGVCRYDPSPSVSLIPPTERLGFMANAIVPLGHDFEAFGEFSLARNTVHTVIQPVPISDQFALPPNHPLFNVAPYNGSATIVLKPDSPYYPTDFVQGVVGAGQALPDVLVRYRAVLAGDRDITDIIEPVRGVLGVRGTFAGWDWDGALLHSASKVTERVNHGYPSYSGILPLLNSGQVNFFGPNTPEVQALAEATQFHGNAYVNQTSLTSLSGRGSGELMALAGGGLGLALGGEFRRESYESAPSAAIQSGDITGYGGNFLPVDRSRKVAAVFGELNAPILKGLELNVAARYDKYQGSGSATTPKASVRWQPTPQVLVRASVGRGFRAPSLTDLYGPQVSGVTANGQSDPLRCGIDGNNSSNDCATQFPILAGGNPDLKPERSRNATLGLVLEPVSGVSIGLDAFDIHLKNTIIPGVPVAAILGDIERFGDLVHRGPVQPDFPNLPGPITRIDQIALNLGQTKIQGVDLDAKIRLPRTEFGSFGLSLSGTYFSRYDVQDLDGTFSPGIADANSLASANAAGIVPRWKHYLALNWRLGPWSATFAQNFQTGYKDVPGTFDDTEDPNYRYHHVSDYTTYDLLASYRFNRQFELALGVKNLLDTDPPYTNNGGQSFFQAGYDPTYADPRGRFVYLRANWTF